MDNILENKPLEPNFYELLGASQLSSVNKLFLINSLN